MVTFRSVSDEELSELVRLAMTRVTDQADVFEKMGLSRGQVGGASRARLEEKWEEFDRLLRRHVEWNETWERDARFASAIEIGQVLVELQTAALMMSLVMMRHAAAQGRDLVESYEKAQGLR